MKIPVKEKHHFSDLVRNLLGPIPRIKTPSGMRAAAKQELVYAQSAHNEGVTEAARSMELKLKKPELSSELKWDSINALGWEKVRRYRASEMLRIADRMERQQKKMVR